jgi:phage shock protein C
MKKMYLSSDDYKISGVCGGVGEYFNIDPTLIRLGVIVVTILTGILPGIIGYVLAVIIIPKKP